MQDLLEAVIDLVANSPPDKVAQLAAAVRRLEDCSGSHLLAGWATNPSTQARLSALTAAWTAFHIPALELAGMLNGAAAAYNFATEAQEVQLVWTGPSSNLIATRKTEQALLQVIDFSSKNLFMTSFVAYDVDSVMAALARALRRNVHVSMLLEASDKHGGSVSIDAIGRMKVALPGARIFSWLDKDDKFAGGRVHAKVAVADEIFCFVSSANLTGHAMERNMEAGVLIRGGATPRDLHRHLEALETTHVIKQV